MTDINYIVSILNEAFKADPNAVLALIDKRVPCNTELANHPSCQVAVKNCDTADESYEIGLLGILNGIVEPITNGGRIAFVWDELETGNIPIGFKAFP